MGLDVVRIEAEPAKPDQVVQRLPDDPGHGHLGHHPEHDDLRLMRASLRLDAEVVKQPRRVRDAAPASPLRAASSRSWLRRALLQERPCGRDQLPGRRRRPRRGSLIARAISASAGPAMPWPPRRLSTMAVVSSDSPSAETAALARPRWRRSGRPAAARRGRPARAARRGCRARRRGPWSTTRIRSAPRIGREPVGDMKVVRPAISRSSASRMTASVCESIAEVGSSRIRIGASLRNARATQMRWRSPPESRAPRSPSSVS